MAVVSSSGNASVDGAVGAVESGSRSCTSSSASAFRFASAASASRFFFPCTFLSLSSESIFQRLLLVRWNTDAPEELFAIHLVKFAHDIFDRVVETGNDDMLDGIHPAIRRTDDLVKDHKCRLERRELDERLDRLGVHLLRSQHLLATSPKAGQIKV